MSLGRVKLLTQKCKALPMSFISLRKLHNDSNSLAEDLDSSETSALPHSPVMVQEVVDLLELKDGNTFLDMTFGAGGHSSAMLNKAPGLNVLALDRDPNAVKYMKELNEYFPNQITPLTGKFSELPDLLEDQGIKFGSIDGILLDLGCSSMQLDNAERGFSHTHNGPIDMRMDGDRIIGSISAADVIAHATEVDLERIFKIYGDEKYSGKIARAIIQSRYNFQPINSTTDLAKLVEIVCEKGRFNFNSHSSPRDSVTRVFQALRIFVNNEINELHYGLMLAHKYLKPGGRVIAIAFHSLEDKIVKAHFKNLVNYDEEVITPIITKNFHKNNPALEGESLKEYWALPLKKALVPSVPELLANSRSKSAKLRGATKI